MTTSMHVPDQYAGNVELYDVSFAAFWAAFAPRLAAALRDVDPTGGPLLDIGAGTGLSTQAIADAIPDAAIFAVEPSPVMRGALFARLMARDDLRHRVTVLPFPLQEAPVTGPLSGAVAVGSIHHFNREARIVLWHWLAERLVPGAPALVHVMPPDRPEVVPETRSERTTVGTLDYESWITARPAGPEELAWTMTFRVLRDGALLFERTTQMTAIALSPADVATEAAEVGLVPEIQPEGLVVLRRT